MAVKIRLTRLGKKKQPTYRVVVMDSRKQRDGKYIEQLGIYDPRQEPSLITIDNERALYWLKTGAQPTERAQKLLEISGAWTQFKVAKGDIHTVGASADADDAVSGETAAKGSADADDAVSDEPAAKGSADADNAAADLAADESVEDVVAEAAVADEEAAAADDAVEAVEESIEESSEES